MIQSRLANDVGGVQSVLTETASSILSNIVTVIGVAGRDGAPVLAAHDRGAGAAAAVRLCCSRGSAGCAGGLAARTQASLSEMTAITQEALSVSGILLAKVFNRQATEIAPYRAENERQVDLQVRQTMTGQSFFAVVTRRSSASPRRSSTSWPGMALSRGAGHQRGHDRRLHDAADAG